MCGSGIGYTLLRAVVEYGQEDAVSCLVDTEPVLDARDSEGCVAFGRGLWAGGSRTFVDIERRNSQFTHQ